MAKNIIADGEKTKVICYYKQYGLLANGLFFYYTNWRLYIDKLTKITPSEANKFFTSNNRFNEDCIFIDARNEVSQRQFAVFLAMCLARKYKVKLNDNIEC